MSGTIARGSTYNIRRFFQLQPAHVALVSCQHVHNWCLTLCCTAVRAFRQPPPFASVFLSVIFLTHSSPLLPFSLFSLCPSSVKLREALVQFRKRRDGPFAFALSEYMNAEHQYFKNSAQCIQDSLKSFRVSGNKE